MEHMEAANNLTKRIIEDTKKVGKVEQPSKLEGRQMTLIIQPI
jgi:translation initiation factor IF-3